jgi:hypothetical protein
MRFIVELGIDAQWLRIIQVLTLFHQETRGSNGVDRSWHRTLVNTAPFRPRSP